MENHNLIHQGQFSDVTGHVYKVRIWSYVIDTDSINTELTFADDAVRISQVPKGNLLGSKCVVNLKSFVEEEFLHLYTGKEGDFLLEIYSDKLQWIGVIIPGYYQEDFEEPPFEVQIQAVDGLGRLKEMYTDHDSKSLTGRKLWPVIMDALSKCNQIKYCYVHNRIFKDTVDIYNVASTDFLLFNKNGKKKSLYDILLEFTKTFDFNIAQRNGVWIMYNEQIDIYGRDTIFVDVWNIFNQTKKGEKEIPIEYSTGGFVFKGGIKTIIPPISTLDVSWSRDSYNVGSNSMLINPTFLENYAYWTYRELEINSSGNFVLVQNDPPVFAEDYNNKSAIQPRGLQTFSGVSIHRAFIHFNIESDPIYVKANTTLGLNIELFVEKIGINQKVDLIELEVKFIKTNGEILYLKYFEEEVDGEEFREFRFVAEDSEGATAYKIDVAENVWTTVEIIKSFTIPEDGKIQIFFKTIYKKTIQIGADFPADSLLDMGVHAINLYKLENGNKNFTESIRIQNDAYGFTEKEEIELHFANKNEILADGNLFQKEPLNFVSGFKYNDIQNKIQYLLAAKIFNKKRKPRESLTVSVQGIVPAASLLIDVPGRSNKRYQLDEIKEYDLRKNKTKGVFTLRNTQCEAVKMDIYNNDSLVNRLTIGCNASNPAEENNEPEINLKFYKDTGIENVLIAGEIIQLTHFGEDALIVQADAGGATMELDVIDPSGNITTYIPNSGRLVFSIYDSHYRTHFNPIYRGGLHRFKIRATSAEGIMTEQTRDAKFIWIFDSSLIN